MSQLDRPNIRFPLVPSYNERGIQGFTNTVTNGIGQRRVNCMYKVARNSSSGKTAIYNVRRPGVTINSSSYGDSGQSGYVLILAGVSSSSIAVFSPWVFSKSGNNIRVSTSSATTNIVNPGNNSVPVFADKTLISGVEQIVLQIRSGSNGMRTFYAASSDSTTWTEITDGDFTALSPQGKMVHMDGFPFVLDLTNKIYNGNLNSLSAWNPTNYITKQIVQDAPAGLARLRNQVLAFGAETMEVFYNAGNASGSPLEVVKQLFQRVGLAAFTDQDHFDCYANVGDRLYFVGKESVAFGVNYGIYAYDGSRSEKVSTPFIDGIITENPIINVRPAMIHSQRAIAFALDAPSAATQRWLMFFPDLNEWFEWNSTVIAPIGVEGAYLGVGSNQHRIYTISNTDNWQDNGTNYTRTIQFKMPKDGNHRKFMRMCGVEGDTARSAQSLNVEFSDDDDQTFQTARAIDRTSDKPHLYRCGSYRTRTVRLSDSGNFEGRLETFVARVD